MSRTIFVFVCIFLTVVASSTVQADNQPQHRQHQQPAADNIPNTIAKIPELSTLFAVLSDPAYADIVALLSSDSSQFTVFAPNNQAFVNANINTSNHDLVYNVLTYHVVIGAVYSNQLGPLQFPRSLLTNPAYSLTGPQYLEITKSADRGVEIKFGVPGTADSVAKVVRADVAASNGVIHIVDQVLLPPAATSTVATVAGLNTLLNAVIATGLAGTVDNTPNITIFAPTDQAFAASSLDGVDVKTLLTYHVVAGVVFSSDLKDGQVVSSLGGASLVITIRDGVVRINESIVVVANVLTKNGVVHVIDRVIGLPSKINNIFDQLQVYPQLSILSSLVSSTPYSAVGEILKTKGPFTLFAPTNNAIAASGIDPSQVEYVTAILTYHLLSAYVPSSALAPLQFPETNSNNQKYVNLGNKKPQVLEVIATQGSVKIVFGIPGVAAFTANVVIADIISANGVIHVIDKVLLLPVDVATTATTAGLTSLVNAVVSTNLAGAVDDTAALTIFAPTNDAFNQVGPVDNATLTRVLLYHVVPSSVLYSLKLSDGQTLQTLNGNTLKISINNGLVFVNDAQVILPNVLTKNGVVHVINKVLLPPNEERATVATI